VVRVPGRELLAHRDLQPALADRVAGEEQVAVVVLRVGRAARGGELGACDGSLEARRHRIGEQDLVPLVVEPVDGQQVVGMHVPVGRAERQMEVVDGGGDRAPVRDHVAHLRPGRLGVRRAVPA
jgi:hypothetical protein